jgi:methylated-DNA-[protein]-cysteine S-methyltransferase
MIRNLKNQSADSNGNSEVLLSVFPTEIGWMGVLGDGQIVAGVVIGHPTAVAVRKAVRGSINIIESVGGSALREEDWLPELRESLQNYAQGKRVEFANVRLQLPLQTRFRDKVLAATRSIGYGETASYGDLARRIGHPGAARAVGTVMSTNRFPILIPCHRVLAAGGKLGGYSARGGTCLKQILLDMEQAG